MAGYRMGEAMGTDTRRTGPARILLPALLAGCVSTAYASAVHAQTVPAQSGDALFVEIVVIGSRIGVPNDVEISPVTAVTADAIEQAGVTRIEGLHCLKRRRRDGDRQPAGPWGGAHAHPRQRTPSRAGRPGRRQPVGSQ
jgi:hypothetical protein